MLTTTPCGIYLILSFAFSVLPKIYQKSGASEEPRVGIPRREVHSSFWVVQKTPLVLQSLDESVYALFFFFFFFPEFHY